MSEDDLHCLNCGWVGVRQELICLGDKPLIYIYCPDCKLPDHLEIEDDEDD